MQTNNNNKDKKSTDDTKPADIIEEQWGIATLFLFCEITKKTALNLGSP